MVPWVACGRKAPTLHRVREDHGGSVGGRVGLAVGLKHRREIVAAQVLHQRGQILIDATNPFGRAWPGGYDSRVYASGGALVHVKGYPSGGNSTLVYFNCDDCAVEEARVKGAGGKVERPKMSIGDYGFITLAHDTEGNMFGLHSTK